MDKSSHCTDTNINYTNASTEGQLLPQWHAQDSSLNSTETLSYDCTVAELHGGHNGSGSSQLCQQPLEGYAELPKQSRQGQYSQSSCVTPVYNQTSLPAFSDWTTRMNNTFINVQVACISSEREQRESDGPMNIDHERDLRENNGNEGSHQLDTGACGTKGESTYDNSYNFGLAVQPNIMNGRRDQASNVMECASGRATVIQPSILASMDHQGTSFSRTEESGDTTNDRTNNLLDAGFAVLSQVYGLSKSEITSGVEAMCAKKKKRAVIPKRMGRPPKTFAVQFLCPRCNAIYYSQRGLWAHGKMAHSQNSQYKCIFCSAGYSTKGHLENHIARTHLFPLSF